MTFGSSSCPMVPSRLETTGDAAITITSWSRYSDACTADLSSRSHEFDLPPGVTGRSISVVLQFDGVPGSSAYSLD